MITLHEFTYKKIYKNTFRENDLLISSAGTIYELDDGEALCWEERNFKITYAQPHPKDYSALWSLEKIKQTLGDL